MVNQQQEKPQDFELIELLFQEIPSTSSDSAADLLDKSFKARFQSLVNQIQSYLHSGHKAGFFPHRFLGWFSSVLDTKLNDKLGIEKLHFRFQGARTLKVVAETKAKIHVFIFTEDIEAQYSQEDERGRVENFEFTTGEFKSVMGRDYKESDARKLQIDVIKILKDKYEPIKGNSKDAPGRKELCLYFGGKKKDTLKYRARSVRGTTQEMQINRDELEGDDAFKGEFFNEIKQFLKSGKNLSDGVRKELSRITSAKGYTLKGGDEKINIEVETNKRIEHKSTPPPADFTFQEVTKKLGKSVYLEDHIEKLANSDVHIDQVQGNLEKILEYIKEVHSNLKLQSNVYGNQAREADQHGFVAGIFDNFRYRDNTKIYLEQFAGRGYADIVLLVRGPDRAVDSVPILIELKVGTTGKVTPSDALEQVEDYVKGFRPNKMRILTNAGNAIVVGLNLGLRESFKIGVKPIQQSSPLMEKILTDIHGWDGTQQTRTQLEEQIKSALSSEYDTFTANKETRDIYYFSRDIVGQSILVNKFDGTDVEKYVFSYDEYPLEPRTRGGAQSKQRPVTTLVFTEGSKKQDKTVFIFHIIEQAGEIQDLNPKKIPVMDIPGVGKNVIEITMGLKKYKENSSFEDLFKIKRINKYEPSNTDQRFEGKFLKIPNSDKLKAKFDQLIDSQRLTSFSTEELLSGYKELFKEVANAIYPVKDLITNEAELQAVLNGLFSNCSDLKLKETSVKQVASAKTVIIPEFQIGAGDRVDMVIQGIGPSPQGTKEYIPVALEFKLIDKNLDENQMKQEVDKLTEEQNTGYAQGAALKTITDSDKMLFMGVVVDVKAEDKDSLILTSDEFISARIVHSSIDIAKREHLEELKKLFQRFKSVDIQEEDLRTLESETAENNYSYWLQQHDIPDIARVGYGFETDRADTLFEVVGSPEHITNQLQLLQRDERRPLTLIVNSGGNHWVTLVIAHQNGQYNGYYVDSLGNNVPDNIRQVLQQAQITVHDVSIAQQTDGHNCGLWALENARDINAVLQGDGSHDILDEIRNRLQVQERDEAYFEGKRQYFSGKLSIDSQRIANLQEVILAEVQRESNLNSCAKQGSRKKRNIGMACVDSRDEENITKEEKERRIKELFDTEEMRGRAKNVELYDQLFKVSEQVSKGEAIDSSIGEAFIAKLKDTSLNSIDPEIRGIVGEIKEKISEEKVNKEEIKTILRRPEVAEKISRVTGDYGLTYSKFLDDGGSKFQNIINKINSHPEVMNHLNRIGKISGWAMEGMMYKNLVGDILSGNLEGVAINLGFIGGSNVLGKVANTVAIRGEQFISEGKVFLGKSLKAASPFLARATSAFIVYDLVNQVKAFKSGDKNAMVGIIGDSIALTVDVAEIGIEIAEVAGILSGVSSVTGPIGAGITAIVFIGTDIYLAVKTVEQEDKVIHLTGWEKFKEGWRASLHIKPEEYIEKLIEEKLANDHLVENAVDFLRQHTGIRKYFFPTGKLVDRKRIEVDLNNKVLLDERRWDIKWSRARPSAPRDGMLFCLPKGDWESIPDHGAYLCENAIGLSYSANRTGDYTLIDLGEGNDEVVGSQDNPNIFFVGDGNKNFTGGNEDDIFILHGNHGSVVIDGGNGSNTLDLTKFALGRNHNIVIGRQYYQEYLFLENDKDNYLPHLELRGIQKILGREKEQDTVGCIEGIKYVDGKGGRDNNHPDLIYMREFHDYGELKIAVRPDTEIRNPAFKGNFDYIIFHGEGDANIYITNQESESQHRFLFNYTLSDLKGVNIQNFPDTARDVKFSFQPGSSGIFNINIETFRNNLSYVLLKDNTEIKIGNKGNLYALKSTDKPIDEVIRDYPIIANRLNMTIAVEFQDEFIIIGHGKHEVINNEPLRSSHLIGNGGENVYVITPTQEKVTIYDVHEGIAINTLDLRSVVKNAQDASLKISQDENDLLIELEEGESLLKFPVRIQDGIRWYQKLHVVVNSVPMRIECSDGNWNLSLTPLAFDENAKIAVITAKDVDEENELVVNKRAGQYTFSRFRDDLVITTIPGPEESDAFTMLLSNFYREPKMETLSIEFNDTTISIQEKMDEINSSKLLFCSSALQVNEPFSIDGRQLLNNHDCLKFDSDQVVFFRSNDDLLLLSDQGVSVILNYYSHVHGQWNLPIELNNSIIKPEEFREKADDTSAFKYYLPREEGLQIYHNQPTNKYQVGLVDLRDRPISDYNMRMNNGSLVLLSRDNTIVEVENWNTYPPARKMMFIFDGAIVVNAKCVTFSCGPGNIIEEFREVASVNDKDVNGYTKLHNAVLLRDLAKAKSLLDIGANINAKENLGKTPLYLAVEKDEPNMVKLLLKRNADVNARDNDSRAPLQYAIPRYLIGKGVKEDIRFNIIKLLLNGDADVNTKDNNNRTLLHNTIIAGDLRSDDEVFNLVQLLINKDATGINNQDTNGNTPLHYAVWRGTLSLVQYLVNKGAKASIQNNKGETSLDLARVRGKVEIANFLEENKESVQNRRYRRFVEPLVLSVINNVESVDGNAALRIAIEEDNLDVVKSLVREVADINAKDSNGKTILNLAIENGKLDIVQFLVNEGASIHSRNSDGWTPLHYSAYCGRRDVVELLISKGADINAKDNDGKTSFKVALEHNQIEVVNYIIVAKDKYGYTALHYAAKEGNLNLVKLLLDNGANINGKNSDGWTPLQLAAKNNKLEMVKHLIEKGADVNTKNNYGWTSLHYAYAFGTSDMVKLVMKNGADINAKTNRGETPLEVACEYGNLEVVNFLERSKESIQHRIRHGHRKQHHRERLQEGSSIGARDRRSIAKGTKQDLSSNNVSSNSLQNDEMDHSREKATSGASKPSLWVSIFTNPIKSVSQFISSSLKAVLPERSINSAAQASMSSTKSPALLTSGGQDSATVTAVPEINATLVNNTIMLAILATSRYRQPIHKNLLSPREQSMRLNNINEDMIIKAIQQGKEKFGGPGTCMDEVEISSNKTRIGKFSY